MKALKRGFPSTMHICRLGKHPLNVSASMGRSSSASTKQSGNEADKGLSIPPSNSMEAHNNFAPSDSPANN